MPTIKKPNEYFDARLWTGNGPSSQNITGLNFQPDLVWVKNRSSTRKHNIYDSVRGTTKRLVPNDTVAEDTPGGVTAFNSNGFTVDAEGDVNASTLTFVGWTWKAGGTSTVNTSGTISSNVSVNTTAGFSIVTYTGNGSSGNIGHGLGVAPKIVLVKNRTTGATQWVFFTSIVDGSWDYLLFNSTAAKDNAGETAPTSTTFNVASSSSSINTNGDNYVAYCWAEVEGFSKFGSYVANASSDGPFIYTGFRPRWIMFKRTTSSTNWYVIDTAISPYNASTTGLYPNTTDAVSSEGAVDILSNGFKCRVSSGAFNYPSGETFMYAAFAESPLKYSNAR